ncbi:MAG: AmmeMemoRadiSam system protein B [Desulfovibrio sp.]
MNRQPIVAGQFYPGDPAALYAEVERYLAQADAPAHETRRSLLAMVPHAGYVFSGGVCGKTLGQARLPRTLVLLGPNHTGLGERLAVWPDGHWLLPGARLEVDGELAAALLEQGTGLRADTLAHVREHSLEVVLPFLHRLNPETRIVPIVVADPSPDVLLRAGKALGRALADWPEPVSLVVSSDMSHYVSDARARELDGQAVDAALSLDPLKLYETVRARRISMCGVLPMTLGLAAARELGATEARLAAYATSGEASRDFEQVVGYAGVLVD